LLRNKRR